MAKPKTDDDMKWLMIGVAIIFTALFMAPAISSFATDSTAQQIAACVSQDGMEFVDGDCRPIQPTQ